MIPAIIVYANKSGFAGEKITAIGQALSSCYEVPQELPSEMLALVMRLDARHEE
jgi:hypothetical protein